MLWLFKEDPKVITKNAGDWWIISYFRPPLKPTRQSGPVQKTHLLFCRPHTASFLLLPPVLSSCLGSVASKLTHRLREKLHLQCGFHSRTFKTQSSNLLCPPLSQSLTASACQTWRWGLAKKEGCLGLDNPEFMGLCQIHVVVVHGIYKVYIKNALNLLLLDVRIMCVLGEGYKQVLQYVWGQRTMSWIWFSSSNFTWVLGMESTGQTCRVSTLPSEPSFWCQNKNNSIE